MVRRILAVAVLLALLAAPSAALAQTTQQPPGGDFGPLPQAAPTETPTPQKSNNSLSSDLGGNETLFIIGGALLIAFIASGFFLPRAPRRSLPEGHRPGSGLREE